MKSIIQKRLFQGFVCLHILHHAEKEPFYGTWMLEELSEHGHRLSPGTLYPILHSLEKDGLLTSFEENVEGKIRRYYTITELGKEELREAHNYLKELTRELEEKGGKPYE
jgi:DNA-binding PadR family transcriptional regulator